MISSLQVTPEQLQRIAYERNLTKWVVEECPVCDYSIHYLFNGKDREEVQYDAGCTCSDLETLRARYMRSSWEQVADYVNKLSDQEKIKKVKQYWNI